MLHTWFANFLNTSSKLSFKSFFVLPSFPFLCYNLLINDYKISETSSVRVNRDNVRELKMSEQEVMKHLNFSCDGILITINRRFSE